jgi:hypothetical protein
MRATASFAFARRLLLVWRRDKTRCALRNLCSCRRKNFGAGMRLPSLTTAKSFNPRSTPTTAAASAGTSGVSRQFGTQDAGRNVFTVLLVIVSPAGQRPVPYEASSTGLKTKLLLLRSAGSHPEPICLAELKFTQVLVIAGP